MTLAAAGSFIPDGELSDKRANSIHSDTLSAIQSSRSSRTANLSDWQLRRADIQLSPVSCLDVYQSLVLHSKPMLLLPADSPSTLNKAQLTNALTTKHPADRLTQRCRKLEAETTPGQTTSYKLYVAAGFVKYEVNNSTRRIPILLVPVTINRLRGRGSSHTISCVRGAMLQLNPQVAELCDSYLEPQTKPFQSSGDFRDYLHTVKASLHKAYNGKVSANTGIISLRDDILNEPTFDEIFDLELERTKPGIDFQPLPATPDSFDAQLAIKILRFVKRDDLNAVLNNFSATSNDSPPVLDAEPNLDEKTLEKYYNCAAWLVDVGLGHWQLKNIRKLPARLNHMIEDVSQLMSNNVFQNHIHPEFRTLEVLYRLSRCKDKICNAPPEMRHHASSQHAHADTRILLQRAKIQAASLEQQLENIHQQFRLNTVPNSGTLSKLINTIINRDDESQLDNPNYFRARRRLNEILDNPNGFITDNDLNRLEQLAATLEFSETFDNDPYYKRHFGSLFKGLDTNWQRLDSVVNYTKALAEDLGSALLVAQIVDHWASFERDFKTLETQIEQAASSAYKISALIPTFINQNTRLEHAVQSAKKYQIRIDKWQKFLRKHFADVELTPVQLLSNIELCDYAPPTVILSQLELDERIYQHIVGHGVSDKTISATSAWLQRAIERLHIDLPTIRRFLDKEAEFASQLSAAR